MGKKLSINLNQKNKIIQTKVSHLQYATIAFLVEKGKAKSQANFLYLALNSYSQQLLKNNKSLSEDLYKFLEQIKSELPDITFIPKKQEIFPTKTV